jgi:hypothetical protein
LSACAATGLLSAAADAIVGANEAEIAKKNKDLPIFIVKTPFIF